MNAEIIVKLPIKSGIRQTAARPYDSALSVNHWIVQMWSVWFKGATNVLKHGRLLRRARQVLPSGVWGRGEAGTGPAISVVRSISSRLQPRPKTARRTHVGRLANGIRARQGTVAVDCIFSRNDHGGCQKCARVLSRVNQR